MMSAFDDIVAAIDTVGQVAKIEAGEATLTDIMRHDTGAYSFKWENGLGTTPRELLGWPFEYRPYLEGWRVIGTKPGAIVVSDDFNEVQANRYSRHKNRLVTVPPIKAGAKFLLLFWDEGKAEWVPHPVLLDSERSASFTATNNAVRNAAYGKTKIIPLGVLDNG